MTFRSDLDALRARHDALETEVATKQGELLETRRMLDEVQRRARLPVLDNIRVAAPCTADWSRMQGDERVRACGDCNKNVYNLSGMTREEAEALLLEKEGRLCVRYYRRADGTILFNDCEIGIKRRRRRRVIAGAAALLATAGSAYMTTRAMAPTMGKMAVEPVEQVLGGLAAELPPGHTMGSAVEPPPQEVMGLPEPPAEVLGERAMPFPQAEQQAKPVTPVARTKAGGKGRGAPGRVGGSR